ncbi:hypothetical protein SAMN05216327_11199 [Dyadobacter sp. SG02]|uniref:hypothetical protein n=1 Tax=Dyadobacter sp. SG02 TaxID=1855291 RepID=UPI0008CBEE77|nr:hypothetical protein [Dyadobacter sp. SG02]SEJ48617.1 hypothetical protein SAMN05216327_11199 [Dyadobacter sp. SG02]
MPAIKEKKVKRDYVHDELPPNYYEFFEKKAEEARRFLELNPVPENLFKKK